MLAQAQPYAAAPVLSAPSADAQALLGNPRLNLTEVARYDPQEGRPLTRVDDTELAAVLSDLAA